MPCFVLPLFSLVSDRLSPDGAVFTALSQAVPFESCPVPSVSCDRSLSLSVHVFASVFQRWELDSGPIVLVFRLLLVAILVDKHQAHQLCALVQRRAELVVSQGESVLNFDWSKS